MLTIAIGSSRSTRFRTIPAVATTLVVMALAGCSGVRGSSIVKDADRVFSSAFENTISSDQFAMRIDSSEELVSGNKRPVPTRELHATGSVNLRNDSEELEESEMDSGGIGSPGSSNQLRLNAIDVDGITYLHSPEITYPPGIYWRSAPTSRIVASRQGPLFGIPMICPSSASAPPVYSITQTIGMLPGSRISTILGYIRKVAGVTIDYGVTEVEGVKARHYHMEEVGSRCQTQLQNQGATNSKDNWSIDVWITKSDFVAREHYKLNLTQPAVGLIPVRRYLFQFDISYSKFGEPANIAAPPTSQVQPVLSENQISG